MELDPDNCQDNNFSTNEIALKLCDCNIWTFSWRSTRPILCYRAQATLSKHVSQSSRIRNVSVTFSSGLSERIHMEHPELAYVCSLFISLPSHLPWMCILTRGIRMKSLPLSWMTCSGGMHTVVRHNLNVSLTMTYDWISVVHADDGCVHEASQTLQ